MKLLAMSVDSVGLFLGETESLGEVLVVFDQEWVVIVDLEELVEGYVAFAPAALFEGYCGEGLFGANPFWCGGGRGGRVCSRGGLLRTPKQVEIWRGRGMRVME